jgi:hypothetical protein
MLDLVSGQASDRKLRLFVCACCRSALRFVTHRNYRPPIERSARSVEELVDRGYWMDEDEEREFARSAFPAQDFLVYGADASDPTTEELAAYAAGDLAGSIAVYREPWAAAATAAKVMLELGRLIAFFESDKEAAVAGEAEYERARAGGASHKEAWDAADTVRDAQREAAAEEGRAAVVPEVCELIREVFGSSLPPPTVSPSWVTPDVKALAQRVYSERAFAQMPQLADLLVTAGCENAEVLGHCRQERMHCRGCWVIDILLGKS